MVRNRAEWTVTGMDQDALTLTLRNDDGAVVLPASYVDCHLELGYAQTIHAAQGRTVDRCLLVADGAVDGRGVYVGMTRGRLSNEALVTVDGNTSAIDVLSAAIARDWDDAPAIETRRELGALAHDADGLVQTSGADLDATDRVRQRLERQFGLERRARGGRSIDDDFGAEL